MNGTEIPGKGIEQYLLSHQLHSKCYIPGTSVGGGRGVCIPFRGNISSGGNICYK